MRAYMHACVCVCTLYNVLLWEKYNPKMMGDYPSAYQVLGTPVLSFLENQTTRSPFCSTVCIASPARAAEGSDLIFRLVYAGAK